MAVFFHRIWLSRCDTSHLHVIQMHDAPFSSSLFFFDLLSLYEECLPCCSRVFTLRTLRWYSLIESHLSERKNEYLQYEDFLTSTNESYLLDECNSTY